MLKENISNLISMIGTEITSRQEFEVTGDLLETEVGYIPGEIHGEGEGYLHRLDVTDIDNPYAVSSPQIGVCELLQDLCYVVGVGPLVRSGKANIFKMIIYLSKVSIGVAENGCR